MALIACNLYLQSRDYQSASVLSTKVLTDRKLTRIQKADFELVLAKIEVAQNKEDKAYLRVSKTLKDLERISSRNLDSKGICTRENVRMLLIEDLSKKIVNLPSGNNTSVLDQKVKLYEELSSQFKKMETGSEDSGCDKTTDALVSIRQASDILLKQIESLKDTSTYNKYIDVAYKLRSDMNYFGTLDKKMNDNVDDTKDKLFNNL